MGFPKLAPTIVRRARIEAWLDHHARTPLRLIAAPAGSGKTTAVVSSLRASGRAVHYYTVRSGDGARVLRMQIAEAIGAPDAGETYAALLAALERAPACEVVFDDIDGAEPAAIGELLALVNDAPPQSTFIAIARSRQHLADSRLFTSGLAAICDAERLAFTAEEIVALSEALDVGYTSADVGRLLEETEGWAVVVSGAIREAAAGRRALGNAYDAWRKANARVFAHFLDDEAERASPDERAAVDRLCSGASVGDFETLERLERIGLFVRYVDSGYRPYRVVTHIRRGEAPSVAAVARSAAVGLLMVRMFGRFEAQIAGRDIAWVRRRDQHIFQYLLLKESGRASRAELQGAFWPGVDRSAAAQNLRTACSTIRKAIAAAVGYDVVERYFTVRGDIAVTIENTIVDVRRFDAHVREGHVEYDRGNLTNAIAHYSAAERLYAGTLLCAELPDSTIGEKAAVYDDAYFLALERLADCWFERGNIEVAGNYASRVLAGRPEARTMHRMLTTIESTGDAQSGVASDEDDVPPVAIERAPGSLGGDRLCERM